MSGRLLVYVVFFPGRDRKHSSLYGGAFHCGMWGFLVLFFYDVSDAV